MPGLRWEFSAPNALGNVALNVPFPACMSHSSQISLISFLKFLFLQQHRSFSSFNSFPWL